MWLSGCAAHSCESARSVLNAGSRASNSVLESSLDLACFNTRRADLQSFHCFVDDCSNWLQVWEPAPFIMWVKVGTKKGVIKTGHRSFSANITTLGHVQYFPKEMLNFLPSRARHSCPAINRLVLR